MKIPKNIHGRKFANHLIRHWDFVEVRQTGSHIILRTETPSGYTLSVPDHKPVRPGTLHDMISAVAQHKKISREEVLLDF